MAVSIESLGIDRMSIIERLDLIEQIWNSLPDEISPQEVPEWHLAELIRRRAGLEAEPDLYKPWRDVLNRLEQAT
jgi:putative addiction module component (TIGR02574 family)